MCGFAPKTHDKEGLVSEIGEYSPFVNVIYESMPRLSNVLIPSAEDVAEKITCPLRDP